MADEHLCIAPVDDVPDAVIGAYENGRKDGWAACRIVEGEPQRRRVAVLRREVRRLNEKVAAMSAVIAAWRAGGFDAVQSVRDARVLSGRDMWALRQALGLTACEVSNADVIRAAAKRIAGGG